MAFCSECGADEGALTFGKNYQFCENCGTKEKFPTTKKEIRKALRNERKVFWGFIIVVILFVIFVVGGIILETKGLI